MKNSFDLGTFDKVPLSFLGTDINGNLVPGVKPLVESSDPTVVTLSDNGDGTATAARVTADAGTVTITATVTNPDGSTASGEMTLSLGSKTAPPTDVVDIEIVAGQPS